MIFVNNLCYIMQIADTNSKYYCKIILNFDNIKFFLQFTYIGIYIYI